MSSITMFGYKHVK